MGFFRNICNKASSFVSSAKKKISEAGRALKNTVSQAGDWVKEKVSNIRYDSESTQSRVDVEKVLADFKAELKKVSEIAERALQSP